MKRFIALATLAVAAILGLALTLAFLRHWWAIHTGVTYLMCKGSPCPNQIYYNFWSGFGSDIGEATLVSAVVVGVYTAVRKVNCHTKGCWRIGHHQLEGTPYILCKHHHPHVPKRGASHDHILQQHNDAMIRQGKTPLSVTP